MEYTYRFVTRESATVEVSEELAEELRELDHEERLAARRYRAHNVMMSAFPDAEGYFPDDAQDTEGEALRTADIGALNGCLRGLSAEQRRLLLRVYGREESLAAIAREEGVTYQAIQHRLARIMNRLTNKIL